MCCQSMHLIMSVSDSRCDSMDLIPEDYQLAIDFLIKFSNSVSSAEVVADFANFQEKQGLYSNNAIWSSSKYVGLFIWWKSFLKKLLSQLAVKLFSISPSHKRILSLFGNTHTFMWNRLINERVSKFIAVKFNIIL